MPIIFVDNGEESAGSSESVLTGDIDIAEFSNTLPASQESLDDSDYDFTWGGIKSRYMYYYTAQKTPENSDDTDQTESVLSGQSKETLLLVSEPEVDDCCSEGCICHELSRRDVEYEPISNSSSGFNLDDSNSSESTVFVDYSFTKKTIASDNISHISSDAGYVPDATPNSDGERIIEGIKLPPPACFRLCLQCRGKNPNAYFQYCYTCFKNRMNFFEEKPKPKKRKRSDSTVHTKSCNSIVDSQKPGLSSSHQSDSISTSEVLAQETIDQSKTISGVSIEEMRTKTKNICKVCFMMPQNGVFNHGKVGHIFSCYACTKQLYKKSKKCPICNVKVKFITKMIVV